MLDIFSVLDVLMQNASPWTAAGPAPAVDHHPMVRSTQASLGFWLCFQSSQRDASWAELRFFWLPASRLCFLRGAPIPLGMGISTHGPMEESVIGHHFQSGKQLVLNRKGRMDKWMYVDV